MKNNRVDIYKQKSVRRVWSEDDFVVNEESNIYGVFDGATPIDDYKDVKGRNGAYLASHLFKEYFSHVKDDDSLHEHVVQANLKLRELMKESSVDLRKKENLWCTCVALIKRGFP